MYQRIVTVLLLLAACGAGGDRPAVEAGSRSISREEMAPLLEIARGDSAVVASLAWTALDRLLIVEDASARGLDTLPEVRFAIWERSREHLQYAYLMYKLGQVEVSDDTVSGFHSRLGSMVMLTAVQVGDSALAESLRTAVAGGADAGDVAASFTELEVDRPRRGRVGPVDFMRLQQFDIELVEGLVQGGVSPVRRMPGGWRFVRLDSLWSVPVEPLEDVEEEIREYLWARISEQYKKQLLDSLVTALHLEVVDGAPELIVSHALDRQGAFSPYSAEEASMPACTWDGGERTVLSMALNIRNLPPVMPRDATDTVWVRDYCGLMGTYDMMALQARRLGLDQSPELAAEVRNAADGVLLDAWFETVVAPRTAVTEEEVAAAWQDNRSMLLVAEKRVFRAVSATAGAQADLLRELVETGADPFVRVSDLTVPHAIIADEGALLTRPLEAGDLPEDVSEAAFALSPGGSGLYETPGGALIFLELAEVVPAREATLAEASPTLRSVLAGERQEEVLAGLVDSLRSTYSWNIDWEFFARFERGPAPGRM